MYKILCLFFIALSGASALSFDATGRISNGNVAAEGQFPYMASLQQVSLLGTPTRGHKCGGVLITLQHMLTAASCLYEQTASGTPMLINVASYRVFAGAVTLSNDADPNRSRQIANYTIHPEFLGHPAYLNDIAIITLSTPFINSTNLRALPLPNPLVGPQEGTSCTVAGWGAETVLNEPVLPSLNLKFADKYVYSQSICQKLYAQQGYVPNIFPTMLCSASPDIVSTGCRGDEGNPLVCDGLLSGILFYSNECRASSFPELYTRVSNYTVWARSITGGASTFQPGVLVLIFAAVQILAAKYIN